MLFKPNNRVFYGIMYLLKPVAVLTTLTLKMHSLDLLLNVLEFDSPKLN